MLNRQCDFGPRPPGSEEHVKTRDFLASELKRHTKNVEIQELEHKHTRWDKTYKLYNIIARFGDSETPSILLCAHWDTRPIADHELDKANRDKPIMGANDGASGVAVLLELARMFAQRPPAVPVTIVLFDGEDIGPTIDDMLIGSRYFARKVDVKSRFRYGILLDMIGDKDLRIYRERYSEMRAKAVADKIWAAAAKLGHGHVFVDEVKYAIQDDHLPLIEAGLPCADVIDFDYPYWHTLKDTVDKCSPESLRVVGETIAHVVYSEHD